MVKRCNLCGRFWFIYEKECGERVAQEIYSLKKDTQELHAALWQGKVTHYGEDWIALPREVVRPGESVIFEITRLTELNRPSLPFILWKAIRPETFYWSVVPFVLVCLFGMTQGGSPAWGVGLCSLLGVFFSANGSAILE